MSAKPTLTPPAPQKHAVVTIIEHIYQSQPSPTIHHTHNKRLEGLRCYEILESIQTYSILVWNLGYLSQNRHHPRLKSRGVVMVMDDELKPQPCRTIHYTYNKALEGLGCCDLPEPVQTHTILAKKVDKCKANTLTPPAPQQHIEMTILEHIYQSQPSSNIHHTYDEILEGLRCYEILESIQAYSILVWNRKVLQPKSSPPTSQK